MNIGIYNGSLEVDIMARSDEQLIMIVGGRCFLINSLKEGIYEFNFMSQRTAQKPQYSPNYSWENEDDLEDVPF